MKSKAGVWTRLVLLAVVFAPLTALCEGYKRPSVHALPMRGVVTYARLFDTYCFVVAEDGTGPWRVDCNPAYPNVHTGDLVEVVSGETRADSTTLRVVHAALNKIGHDDNRVPATVEATIAELYRHPLNDPAAKDLWGVNVSVEGVLRDVNRRQNFTQLQISDGIRSFQASVYISIDNPLPEDLKIGATVRVEGVMVYTAIDDKRIPAMVDFDNVSVMPFSIGSVTVISRAPYWTGARVGLVAGVIALIAFSAFGWVMALRRAVARKTAQLAVAIRGRQRDKIEADAIRRERLRFSYELHDNFQQLLASCRFRLETLDLILSPEAVAEREQLEKAQTALDYTQQGLRAALWGMTEESEGPRSFSGLLQFAMKRMSHWEGVVFLKVEGEEPTVARKFAGLLLMVVQEAVGNALRHGVAAHVDVHVVFGVQRLVLTVSDNGCGFDVSKTQGSEHLGLVGMRSRVASCAGELKIESALGKGTVITVEVPYKS